ncbi:MAG: trehalose-phosphatase [Mycobacteriaceae bacterium]|nr:trehalose-phosphatase [Mycobacteriaceae bacterium]
MRATIDPRLHDAVIFLVRQSDSLTALAHKLREAGVETALPDLADTDAAGLREAARTLGARAERSVVVAGQPDAITAARDGGISLVIGVGSADDAEDLLERGADEVIDDLADVEVRTGDRRMSEIPNAVESYPAVAAIIRGHRPAVCLDYDGTLSAIVADPEAAQLVDGAAQTLALLAQRCPVAILSGRDLADIRDRVGLPGLWYAGSHGFESVAPDGSYRQNDEAVEAVPILARAAAELSEKLAHITGSRVEPKRFAVAVHYRDVAADDVGEVVASAHRVGRREHLRVTNGRRLVELRPDVDWNKGTTLRWICDQISGAAGPATAGSGAAGPATAGSDSESVMPIYIGDDLTDEDAFDAVKTDGVGILVRHTEDGDRRSAARFTLTDPDQVREFLGLLTDDLSQT